MKNTFDFIHILAEGIKQNVHGTWVSTDLSVEDNLLGSPGGKLNIYAGAVLLAGSDPSARIFTGGGKGFGVPAGTSEDRPLLAEILCDELVEAGVPRDRIVLEGNSNNTYQELLELARLIESEHPQSVGIVTGRWHIPRTEAMLEVKFPELSSKTTIKFVAAEDVLIAADFRKWRALIEAAYKSDWLAARIQMEANGTKQIRDGTYIFH